MNIMICDDESMDVQLIQEKILQWARCTGHEPAIMFYPFSSSEDLLEEWEHGLPIDMLFLDIEIPGEMSGMELAKRIFEGDERIPIVFVTNYAEYACEGYRVNALRYIRKPILYEQVKECMDIAWRRWKLLLHDVIVFQAKSQVLRLPAHAILFVEASTHSVMIHTVDEAGKHELKQSLSRVVNGLPEQLFVQCHKSFVVNLMYVRRFCSGVITMSDGTRITIGRRYQREFVRKFRQYYLGGEGDDLDGV